MSTKRGTLKSTSEATLYFGEKGHITYTEWEYNAGNSNEGISIGEEISRKIQSALYE